MADGSFEQANGNKVLKLSITVPAPRRQVWERALTTEGYKAWATPVAWAGANALLIYILAGLWYSIVSVFGFKWYSEMGAKYPDALGRSWVIAVALSVIGAGLYRLGFRLKV